VPVAAVELEEEEEQEANKQNATKLLQRVVRVLVGLMSPRR